MTPKIAPNIPRRCPRCDQTLPPSAFGRAKNRPQGLGTYCRSCNRDRAREAYAQNREREIAKVVKYQRKYPERIQAQGAAYRAKNAPRLAASFRAWRQRNTEYLQTWRAANKSRELAYNQRRRFRVLAAGPSFSAAEWDSLKMQCDYRCLRCGKSEPLITLTADHVIPVSRGGRGGIENIQPLCGPCNSWKHIRIIDYRKRIDYAQAS